MSTLARAVLVADIAASLLVPATGLAAGQPWRPMLLAGLTVAFATVPEELPILITVLLALGGRQLARQGALLRRLRSGETLGAVTTVVTDKTGTLTENRLRLAQITGDRRTVLATALASQPAQASRREPLETELAAAAAAEGIACRAAEAAVFPFDPARKLASRAWRTSAGLLLAVSGAPEAVLARCALRPEDRRRAEAQAAELAEHHERPRRQAGQQPVQQRHDRAQYAGGAQGGEGVFEQRVEAHQLTRRVLYTGGARPGRLSSFVT
jgi:Ca2+-transporting ATPase